MTDAAPSDVITDQMVDDVIKTEKKMDAPDPDAVAHVYDIGDRQIIVCASIRDSMETRVKYRQKSIRKMISKFNQQKED